MTCVERHLRVERGRNIVSVGVEEGRLVLSVFWIPRTDVFLFRFPLRNGVREDLCVCEYEIPNFNSR